MSDFIIENGVLTKYNGAGGDVVIPDSVTNIGNGAFYNNKSLTSIAIPESVTSIGKWTFSDCSSLTSIAIPDSVTSIGDKAFYGCSSLTSVTIPESVTSIGDKAFYGCSSLTSVTIPDSVTNIGNGAFNRCSSLTSVTIPDSVTSIGNEAFYGCSSLTSVTIPESVTSIGDSTFYGCSSLKTAAYGNAMYLGNKENPYCFLLNAENKSIDGCEIHPSAKLIGYHAFHGCSSLTSITIPESVTSIGGYAFNNCSSLTSITIPESVTSIGGYAFNRCSSLTSIAIPESVTSIGNEAFCGCSSLTGITIPESVTSIGDSTFYGCSSLTGITIPESVTSIGDRVFCGCDGIADPDGFIIVRNVLHDYCGCGGNVTIPESVASIGGYAFYKNKSLTGITIPRSVTSIGGYAFHGCSSLTSITIPDSVTSIGNYAFEDCDSLASITIPDSVTSIGDSAFKDCDSLASITIPDSVTSIAGWAFDGCWSLTSVTLPDSVTSIGGYAFSGCSSLTSITIPESVSSIGNGAFSGCSSLTSITIPERVTSIGSGVFYGCSNLSLMRLPAKLLTINFFRPSTKMLTVELTEDGKVTTVPALFRKDYYSNTFIHENDCLVPIGREDTELFDKVLAAGTYDGFNTNEDGRILAILQRIGDKENPIAGETVPAISGFLVSKLAKTMKKAMESNARENFANLAALGVFTDDAKKKAVKFLKKAGTEEAESILSDLESQSAAGEAKTAERAFPLEKKYEEAYKKIAAPSVVMKYGMEAPEVKTADGSGIAPKECPVLIIALYLKKDGLIPMADELAETLDRESLADTVEAAYEKLTSKRDKTAFLRPLFRFADEKRVRKLFNAAKSAYLDEDAVMKAVLLNDSREAMLLADKYHRLGEYAMLRNLDENALRDGKLSDVGLDENGEKRYELGNQTVTVRMNDDLSFAVFSEGKAKPGKSIPKKGADPEKLAAAEADFSAMKKDAKKIVKSRSEKLFEDFLSGRETKFENWKTSFLGNPLLRYLASMIVWQQGEGTFIVKGKTLITADEAEYSPSLECIMVAHPMEMTPTDVTAWQDYFRKNGLKQPFEQIWEPVFKPESVLPDRYAGATLFWRYPQNAEKHGVYFYSYNDYYYGTSAKFNLLGCSIEGNSLEQINPAEDNYYVLGKFNYDEYTRRVNHIVNLLDRWTIRDRIRKNDIDVMRLMDRYAPAQIREFISVAGESSATELSAALLDYMNKKYPDLDPFAEFTLEL